MTTEKPATSEAKDVNPHDEKMHSERGMSNLGWSVKSEDAPAKDDICGEVHGGHSPDLSWAECDECSHEVYNNKQSNHELHLLCCECLKKIKQQAVEKALSKRDEEYRATLEKMANISIKATSDAKICGCMTNHDKDGCLKCREIAARPKTRCADDDY